MNSNPQKAPSAVIGQLSQAWAGHPPSLPFSCFSLVCVFYYIYCIVVTSQTYRNPDGSFEGTDSEKGLL